MRLKWVAKAVLTIAALLTFGAFFIYNIVIRAANPDMTETRLIMTHWREYSLATILFVLFYLLARGLDGD